MTWVLQSKGVPKELCDKISLMIRKPRHLINSEMLQEQRKRLSNWRIRWCGVRTYLSAVANQEVCKLKRLIISELSLCKKKIPSMLIIDKHPQIKARLFKKRMVKVL